MPLSFTKERREGLAKTLDNLAVAFYVTSGATATSVVTLSSNFHWFYLLGLGLCFNTFGFLIRYEPPPDGDDQTDGGRQAKDEPACP